MKVGSCLGQRAVICRDSAVAYLRVMASHLLPTAVS